MIFVYKRFKKSVSLLYKKCEYYSNTELFYISIENQIESFVKLKKNICEKKLLK